MIRIDQLWLAVEPLDMRAGAERLLARVVQVFGSAQAHHGYPAPFQDPANLMHPDRSLDEIREAELEKIGERITEAAKLNRERAALLNRIRLAAVASPLVFAAIAAWAVSRQQAPTAADKTKIVCLVADAASGGGGTVTCEVGK